MRVGEADALALAEALHQRSLAAFVVEPQTDHFYASQHPVSQVRPAATQKSRLRVDHQTPWRIATAGQWSRSCVVVRTVDRSCIMITQTALILRPFCLLVWFRNGAFPLLVPALNAGFLRRRSCTRERGIGMEQQKCRTQEQQELLVHQNLET